MLRRIDSNAGIGDAGDRQSGKKENDSFEPDRIRRGSWSMNSASRICSLVAISSGAPKNTRMMRPQRVPSSSPMIGALKKSRMKTCVAGRSTSEKSASIASVAQHALDHPPEWLQKAPPVASLAGAAVRPGAIRRVGYFTASSLTK